MKIENVEYRCDMCGRVIENYDGRNHLQPMVKDYALMPDGTIVGPFIKNVTLDMCDECANKAAVINRFRPMHIPGDGTWRMTSEKILRESKFEWIEGEEQA